MTRSPSVYALHAPTLIERGYSVIPSMPGSKIPGRCAFGAWYGMPDWCEKYVARFPSETELEIYSSWHEAGISLVTGGISKIVVIDIDEDAVLEAVCEKLPPTRYGKIGRRGESLIFRMAPGHSIPSRNFYLGGKKVVEVLSDGRQTILPPTIHPDTGKPYVWSRGESLWDVDAQDLPEVGEDLFDRIIEALTPLGYNADHHPEPRHGTVTSDSESPFRDLNNHALMRLSSWVPQLGLYNLRSSANGYQAVVHWESNANGKTMEERGRALSIDPRGIKDCSRNKGYTAIDLVMAAQNCQREVAFSYLAQMTGWVPVTVASDDGDWSNPHRAAPMQERDVIPQPVMEVMPAFTAIAVAPTEVVHSGVPVVLADMDLTHPGGLLEKLIDFIMATAVRPSRMMALGVALTVIGTLAGRRYISPTRTGTHLYTAVLSPSGSGKDHYLSMLGVLLTAAGARHHLGPEAVESKSALNNLVADRPLVALPIDEFAAFVAKINSRRASTHEAGLSAALRTLWGRSFKSYQTSELASKRAVEITAPALSIFGVSTKDELYRAFSGADITNGFMNRFLVLRIDVRPHWNRNALPPTVPYDLAVELTELYQADDNDIQLALRNSARIAPAHIPVKWNETLADAFEALQGEVLSIIDANNEADPFVARCAEIAQRCAMIRAISRNPIEPEIVAEDLEWGRNLALQSAKVMMADAMELVDASDAMTISTKIMRAIEANGGQMSHRALYRLVGRRYKSREFKDIVDSLCKDSQLINVQAMVPAAGGPPSLWYSIRKD